MSVASNREKFQRAQDRYPTTGLRVGLLVATHTPNGADNVLADIKADIVTGSGCGAKDLTGIDVQQDDANNRATIAADNPNYPTPLPDNNVKYLAVWVPEKTTYAISAVDQGTKTFTLTGDATADVFQNQTIKGIGTTGNNQVFTVASAALNGGNTDVVVRESIPDATADGNMEVDDASESNVLSVQDFATGAAGGIDPGGESFTPDLQAFFYKID